jgi:hypothetical protein
MSWETAFVRNGPATLLDIDFIGLCHDRHLKSRVTHSDSEERNRFG